ncbi:TolC family protein [Acidipila rosea]|uniref:Cobalt-zinc-cadmium efflux system outer membrane protein n=1 Tax=Acidipila rosea TaxID=768535 RepID=A0A4R1L9G2_9BACT|nr:TolC family protein [Acidipila rosea]MBW4043581.1 TolC family protein [Acidobacteriota bacterium]TCK73880.1 cobalt-zinc-cadmium efflux system outer membrane protein [Acidipila rosea]
MKKTTLCSAVLLLGSLLQPGFAQTQPAAPLTMQQAVAEAIAHNPSLMAYQQNLLSQRGQEVQAGVRANPYFTLYGTDVTLPAQGASNPYTYSAQVSRLFERGEKRKWRLESARDTMAQTEAQYRDQRRLLTLDVRQAFTSMLVAKAALKLAQDNLNDFRRELDISRDRYKAGDIGKLDFERLDLQLAQFESDEANARQSVAQAADQLQTLLGYDRPRAGFDIAGEVVPPVVKQALPSLEQQALASRPDYQAAQQAVRVADAGVKLAYANGTTDPTLEGEYDRSGTYNSAGFSINIPLRIFDRNQGNKETSKYAAQSSRFAEIAARNQVVSDVDQAWIGYTTSKELSDRYNGHYLDEAKDVLSIAQFAYEHGGLALVDYLDALRENRSTAADALNAYAQTWLAIHQLSYSAATDVEP